MTTKPRTEVPKITPIQDQEFILTKEEVSLACAEWVIRNRKNSRFGFTRPYAVYGTHNTITITIKDTSVK